MLGCVQQTWKQPSRQKCCSKHAVRKHKCGLNGIPSGFCIIYLVVHNAHCCASTATQCGHIEAELHDVWHLYDWCTSQLGEQVISFTLDAGNALKQTMQEEAVMVCIPHGLMVLQLALPCQGPCIICGSAKMQEEVPCSICFVTKPQRSGG